MNSTSSLNTDFSELLSLIDASNISCNDDTLRFNVPDNKSFIDTIIVKRKNNIFDVDFWSNGIFAAPTHQLSITNLTKRDVTEKIFNTLNKNV